MYSPVRRWTQPRLELTVLVAGVGPVYAVTGKWYDYKPGLLTWEWVFGAVAQLAIDLNDAPINWSGDPIAASNYRNVLAQEDPLWPTLAELREARIVTVRAGWMAWRHTTSTEGLLRQSQDFDRLPEARAWVQDGLPLGVFPLRTLPAQET